MTVPDREHCSRPLIFVLFFRDIRKQEDFWVVGIFDCVTRQFQFILKYASYSLFLSSFQIFCFMLYDDFKFLTFLHFLSSV